MICCRKVSEWVCGTVSPSLGRSVQFNLLVFASGTHLSFLFLESILGKGSHSGLVFQGFGCRLCACKSSEAPPIAQHIACPSVDFNVSKHISLVLVFREAEVETYFGAFEHIAGVINWPTNVWALSVGRERPGSMFRAISRGLQQGKSRYHPHLWVGARGI